jgi:hypothetical protein
MADRFLNPQNFNGCKRCAFVSKTQQLGSIDCDKAYDGDGVEGYVCQKRSLLKFFGL